MSVVHDSAAPVAHSVTALDKAMLIHDRHDEETLLEYPPAGPGQRATGQRVLAVRLSPSADGAAVERVNSRHIFRWPNLGRNRCVGQEEPPCLHRPVPVPGGSPVGRADLGMAGPGNHHHA